MKPVISFRKTGMPTEHSATEAALAAYWSVPPEQLLSQLDVTDKGLLPADAENRFRTYGPNALEQQHQTRALVLLLSQFKSPLVLILIFAAAISIFVGEYTDALIVLAVVFGSTLLGFTQEYRAGNAVEKLRSQVTLKAKVLRGGESRTIDAERVVPGDIALLSAGSLIPADGVVLEANDFFVNQAVLTGETFPVEKRAGQVAANASLAERGNSVFRGTSVSSGTARVLIAQTGKGTVFGQIAQRLSLRPPETEFERGIQRFGYLLTQVMLVMVIVVLAVNIFLAKPLIDSLLFALALAVGLAPELLPAIISITLAHGAQAMAKRGVIVRRLNAIENFGSMDVLCTDKTGTLTEARIRLERHVDAQGRDSAHVLELAYLNSFFESGLKSPMDEAILAHEHPDVGAWTKIDEVPFDFERRRVSVLVERAGERLLVLKGAPEDVLRLCTHYETESCSRTSGAACELKSFDDAARAQVQARFDSLGREGFRVLAIACKRAPDTLVDAVVDDESELVLAGFAAFLDPPKASARPALQALAASGVAVKVVTGDNEQVARHVMAELGMPASGVLTGAEIAAMNDDALRARVEDVNLFCRANPQQKNRVLLALKARGHVVGYLGDGINDAPSLHTADVGISVDGAVDVAKQAAAMILLENDLGVLHAGIREGRRTFGNVMKYIMMATSSNFGNMFSMALATLFLPFLPLLPLQILLNNFLYDLSELALPLDRVDEPELASPRRWDMSFIRDFMIRIGPISSVFDFATFLILLQVLHADQAEFRTGWFVESLATQVLVIFVIRTRGNPLASRPHRALVLAALAVVALAIALPFTPLASLLGFTPLPLEFFGLLALLVVVYLAVVQWAKRAFYRHRDACHAAQADSQ